MNHPMFDTAPDNHQQEFLREMARRLQLDDDAMNALIRQTWNRRGPTPMLRPVPIVATQIPIVIQPISNSVQVNSNQKIFTPPITPLVTIQRPPVRTEFPIPGGLLPGIQVSQPPIFTPNRIPPPQPTTMYSDQPLSPTATRKNQIFQPPTNFVSNPSFLVSPTSNTPTFVSRAQQVYLSPGSKEYNELAKLRAAAEHLFEEELKQPKNVQPSYRAELATLAGNIRVYLASKQQYEINLYDYIRELQTFTDQLKDLQAKIAARPIPRYLPELDPEILYRPAVLNQARMLIGAGDLRHLEKMLQVLVEVAEDEVRRFGRDGVFMEDIDLLLRDLQDQIRYLARRNLKPPTIEEYLGILRNWREVIQNLIDARKALGRRCVNDVDPWDMTPIVEIPDNEYIRLSNGMCWQIQSLMEYIRGVNGENISKGLQGYASAKLWEDDADAKRILEHPLVVADKDFRQYFMNVLYGGNANKISNRTLEIMYRTASLFVSRGKPFDEAIQKALTPQQYAIFIKYARGSAYATKNIPANQQQEEIETTIALILKSDATHDFWEYYDSLSPEEKAAIASFRADFEKSLRQCRFGKPNNPENKLCVYVMANIILPVVYRVADIKGLSIEKLNTAEN
jgi:hypothetical protein